MSDDRKLDPVTGDFIDEDAGAFELCDALENKIAFSYLIAAGSWEGDPTLGHGFDELARALNTQENRNRLRDLAKQAVQWLVDGGELDHVDVFDEQIGSTGVAFEVNYYPPQSAVARKAGPFLVPVGAV
jgi:phage gp46-like protein